MPICRKCGKNKVTTAFGFTDADKCRMCGTAPSIAQMRRDGIEKRYPDVTCPNCGSKVQNIIRHIRQEHPWDLRLIHSMCLASRDQSVLELNERVLATRADVHRELNWDPNDPLVYFVQAGLPGRPIKIGFTTDLPKRVGALQNGCPEPVEVLGAMYGGRDLERELHAKFEHLRIHLEWFRAGHDLLGYIWEVSQRGEVIPPRKRGALHVVKRQKPLAYTYEECRDIARAHRVTTADHWRILHKANKLPPKVPWSPRHSYAEVWKSWGEFLGQPGLVDPPEASAPLDRVSRPSVRVVMGVDRMLALLNERK
jgi:hypothetical protein